MYKVICPFTDLQDNRYVYLCGDVYPREGLQPTKKRISELLSSDNNLKKPLIEIDEAKKDIKSPTTKRKRGKKYEDG